MQVLASVIVVVGVLACQAAGGYNILGKGGMPQMPPNPHLLAKKILIACDDKRETCKECMNRMPTLKVCFPDQLIPGLPTALDQINLFANHKEDIAECFMHVCKESMIMKMNDHRKYESFASTLSPNPSLDEVKASAYVAKNTFIENFKNEADNALKANDTLTLKTFIKEEMKKAEDAEKNLSLCTLMEKKAELVSFMGCIGESFPEINPFCDLSRKPEAGSKASGGN